MIESAIMPFLLTLLLAVGAVMPEPLTLEAAREPTAVEIAFRLNADLPDEIASALDAGAEIRLTYPLRVKAKRHNLLDKKVWSGELVTITAFDPVTGRFRCQVVLDGIITSTDEAESIEAAREWLTAPPPVRVELPEERRGSNLKIRVRTIFARGTTWLIFPTQDATPWVEIVLEHTAEPPDTGE